jgi:hypothetical protein
MKKFMNEDGFVGYVGNDVEIKQLYKSIDRAYVKRHTELSRFYEAPPVLIPGRVYGLVVDTSLWYYTIVNDETVLKMMLGM